MPFKSESQRRKFYHLKSIGKMDQKTIDEWESETKGKLPEKVAFWDGFDKQALSVNVNHVPWIAAGLSALFAGLPAAAIGGVNAASYADVNAIPYKNWKEKNQASLAGLTEEQKKRRFVARTALLAGAVGGAASGVSGYLQGKRMRDEAFGGRYRDYGRSSSKSSFGARGASELKTVLNMPGNVSKKTEARKAFLEAAKKNHPDMGGSTEKMQNINDAWEELKKTSWYEKLAFWCGFKKHAWLTTGAGKGVLERAGAESSRDAEEGVSDTDGNSASIDATQLFDRERNPRSFKPFDPGTPNFEQEDGAHVVY